jgi:23S rRNA pseudouridine1911/1915/1917 synthase
VAVDGEVVTDPSAPVEEGARVEVALGSPEESHIGPEAIALSVVWEDADLIVVDKPPAWSSTRRRAPPRGRWSTR